jgi:hypothetical protein
MPYNQVKKVAFLFLTIMLNGSHGWDTPLFNENELGKYPAIGKGAFLHLALPYNQVKEAAFLFFTIMLNGFHGWDIPLFN